MPPTGESELSHAPVGKPVCIVCVVCIVCLALRDALTVVLCPPSFLFTAIHQIPRLPRFTGWIIMPRQKRERTAKPSDTVGSDEEAPRTRGNKRLAAKEAGDNERSPKKAKGNSKVVQSDESEKKSNARTRNRSTATAPEAEETAAPKRRGKSKGTQSFVNP